jgi:hypothetical protein
LRSCCSFGCSMFCRAFVGVPGWAYVVPDLLACVEGYVLGILSVVPMKRQHCPFAPSGRAVMRTNNGASRVRRCHADAAYSGRPSLVSQSAISCIAAHARLNFGLVDPLDGRFYPIDRAARNLPERSAAGVTGAPPRRAADGSRPRVHRGRRLKMQPMPICAPFGLFRSYKPFPCHHARYGGTPPWRHRPSECGRCASASTADSGD